MLQSIFHDITGTTWKEFSEVRWYSKYDILEDIFKKFADLLPVVMRIVEEGFSPANATKLYNLLVNQAKLFKLKIELSAYVEGLYDLRNLCYFLEGDGTDMAFKVSCQINSFQNLYPNGAMKTLPSTNRIIMQSIGWALRPVAAGDGGFVAPLPGTPPACLAQAVAHINEPVTATLRGE